MEAWESALSPGGVVDGTARIIVTVAFFAWNLFEGSLFHTPYPVEWVYLYKFPYWRLFLVVTLIAALAWCPTVGIMVALALFFYLNDLSRLTKPWLETDTQKQKNQ
jgi:hypothetical protein